MESSEGILPDAEKVIDSPVHTGYYQVALQAVREMYPGEPTKEEKVKNVLDAVDKQFVDNFKIFDSSIFTGVSLPVTRISIADLAKDVFGFKKPAEGSPQRIYHVKKEPGNPQSETYDYSPSKKIIYVQFSPFTPPPAGDPGGMANNIYGHVFEELPEVAGRRPDEALPPLDDVEIYAFGTLTSPWSRVSTEFIEGLEQAVGEKGETDHGFVQHAKVFAEFLRGVLPTDEQEKSETTIIFHGGSMGTILANLTAQQLPEYGNRLRLLLDTPTAVHKPTGRTITLPKIGKIPVSGKGFQVLAGFGAEAGIRKLRDKRFNKSVEESKKAFNDLTNALSKRGIYQYLSSEDQKLKQSEFQAEIKLLARGTELHDQYRTHIAQGLLDPATVPISNLATRIIKYGRRAFPYPKTSRTKDGKSSTARQIVEKLRGANDFETRGQALIHYVKAPHWIDRGYEPENMVAAVEKCEKIRS